MTRDEIIEAMDWHGPSTETGHDILLASIERVIARAVTVEREAWREALAPIFRERMGAEQVLEGVQHVIQWRCQK